MITVIIILIILFILYQIFEPRFDTVYGREGRYLVLWYNRFNFKSGSFIRDFTKMWNL